VKIVPTLVAMAATFAVPAAAEETDAYAALKAIDGKWIATTSSGRTREIENHCARTGLFFVCEQLVGGKPAALVVFLPKEHEERKQIIRIQTLTAAGDRPGPWRALVVDGDTWTYEDQEKAREGRRRERTVVTFSGPDSMHAEIQASVDGEHWSTVSSETLSRAP
jgi:hypothetical protein